MDYSPNDLVTFRVAGQWMEKEIAEMTLAELEVAKDGGNGIAEKELERRREVM